MSINISADTTKDTPEKDQSVNTLSLEGKSRVSKIAALVSAHFVNDVYPNLYPGLLPIILMPQLGFSIAAAGMISTVSALTTQLMQPLMGNLADRIGGRQFVVGGLLIGSLFVPLTLAWAPTYILLLLGLLIGGLGNAAFHPHASALMSGLIGKYKGSGMSLFMISGNFGRLVAPLAASLALYLGGRHGLALLIIPGVIMAGWMFFSMNPPPSPKAQEKTFTKGFLLAIKDHGGIGLLAIVAFRFMAVMSIVTLVPIMWSARGIDYSVYNLLLTVIYGAGMVGNLIGGTFSDLIGHKPVITLSAVLSSIALFLFIQSDSVVLGFILIAVLGACLYAADPVVMVFSHQLFPHNKAMASGIIGLGGMFGSLGVTLTGLVADIFTPTAGLTVAAFSILISIPFVLRLESNSLY